MFKRERFKVGLDVGSSFVKLVKLKEKENEFVLETFAVEKKTANAADAIQSILQKTNLSTKRVNISVSGPQVMMRYLTIAKMTQEELQKALKFEVEKQIPFPIDEVILDGHIIKDVDAGKMLVLAVAIKKDYIQARIKSIEEAGLSVNLIDVDSLALTNMFMHANEKLKFLSQENIKVVALVNIGATITNLSIIEEGLIHFSREILIGGKELTEKLSEMLNIDRQAAEELKCDPKDRLPEITPHLELIFTSLISEIRSSFDYYESQSNLPVDRIFLSGGTSLFVGLKDYFNRLLGIPLLECDLISSLGIGANLDLGALKNEAAYLNVACGLALR